MPILADELDLTRADEEQSLLLCERREVTVQTHHSYCFRRCLVDSDDGGWRTNTVVGAHADLNVQVADMHWTDADESGLTMTGEKNKHCCQ